MKLIQLNYESINDFDMVHCNAVNCSANAAPFILDELTKEGYRYNENIEVSYDFIEYVVELLSDFGWTRGKSGVRRGKWYCQKHSSTGYDMLDDLTNIKL